MSDYVRRKEYEARNKKSDEPDLPNVALGKHAYASSEQVRHTTSQQKPLRNTALCRSTPAQARHTTSECVQ